MNAVIVAYDTSGNDQWAKTTLSQSSLVSDSMFRSVTTDSSGNIYAVSSQNSIDAFSYGASAKATGAVAGKNSLLVMYNKFWCYTMGQNN